MHKNDSVHGVAGIGAHHGLHSEDKQIEEERAVPRRKKDDRNIAQRILETALDVVMKQRQNAHGDAENSFKMIADMWSMYIVHVSAKRGEEEVHLTPADVAFMMDLLKTCRAVHGDGKHADHYIDKAGYSSLAAMLMGAK